MAVHVGWNLHRFGRPLDFGYNLAAMIPRPPARSFAIEDVPRGLVVQLLTPGKSLFVWAPATLLGSADVARRAGVASAASRPVWWPRRFRSSRSIRAFLFPEGGYAHGPRHLVPLIPLLLLPLAVADMPWPRRELAACAVVGFTMAGLAVTVSFLEDRVGSRRRRAGRDGAVPTSASDPAPGRPVHRYRLDYIPFKHALTSGRWSSPDRPSGNGPDFFPLHLARARATLPGGTAIPPWMPWALSLPWAIVFVWSALSLRPWLGESSR